MIRLLAQAINLKTPRKKVQVFFDLFIIIIYFLFTRPASPSGIYGIRLLLLILLTTTAITKTLSADR